MWVLHSITGARVPLAFSSSCVGVIFLLECNRILHLERSTAHTYRPPRIHNAHDATCQPHAGWCHLNTRWPFPLCRQAPQDLWELRSKPRAQFDSFRIAILAAVTGLNIQRSPTPTKLRTHTSVAVTRVGRPLRNSTTFLPKQRIAAEKGIACTLYLDINRADPHTHSRRREGCKPERTRKTPLVVCVSK